MPNKLITAVTNPSEKVIVKSLKYQLVIYFFGILKLQYEIEQYLNPLFY